MKKIIATVVLTAALLAGGGVTANADTPNAAAPAAVSPQGACPGGVVRYKASDSSKTFTQASGANSAVTGQGGVTLSISRSTTFTVSGTFTSTTGVTVSAGLAAIKEDIGVSVGVSHSGTSTSSGSWTVPSNWSYGRLEIGSLKHRGTVQKYIENTQCALNASGSAAIYNVPETGWTFAHVNAS